GKQNSLGRQFGADVDFSFHFPDDGLTANHFHHNPHLIARDDRPPEFGFIDTHEVDKGFAEVGVLFKQAQNRAGLRHGFDRQNPWHDRRARKMAAEEWLVDGDVLERDDTFIRVDLENAVDQEKRIPMRKNPHDFSYAQFHALKEATKRHKKHRNFVLLVLFCGRSYFLGGSAGFGAGAGARVAGVAEAAGPLATVA